MLSKKINKIIFIFLIILISGCEESNSTNNNDESQNISPIVITTGNVNSGDIYINLKNGEEVDAGQTWHFSIIKDTSNYNMPSIFMGDVDVAIYEDIPFENINIFPIDFDNRIVIDNDSFSYGGENEVLSYDITVHKVSVTNPNLTYVLRHQTDSSSVFKLQFIEYQSGITVFHYNQF